jgi:hypothetical protein
MADPHTAYPERTKISSRRSRGSLRHVVLSWGFLYNGIVDNRTKAHITGGPHGQEP